MLFLSFSILCCAAAIGCACYFIWKIFQYPSGDEKMQEIAGVIQAGANEYLKLQYKVVAIVAVVIACILGIALNAAAMVGFLIGAFASALAGFIGMNVSVRANVKTAEAAKSGLSNAFSIAFKGGAVTGLLVVGFALLVLSIFYAATYDIKALMGLGFGGSLISVFARLGGGIFTKGADVGADLVGKIEAGIPEDDARNPAVIADNVGDNVGDCAGMAADLFETYVVTAVGAMFLGYYTFPGKEIAVILPLIIGGISILSSIFGIFFVHLNPGKEKRPSILNALFKGLFASSILAVFGLLLLSFFSGEETSFLTKGQLFFSMLVGILETILIFFITEYYTSKKFRPVRSIAHASETGHGTNIIMGLSVGMESTSLPVIVIVAGILGAYAAGGLYGIALAVMSMLSMAGVIVMIDAFGPIIDNAGGIAEMANLPESVRKATDALDAAGNTTKAVTKGYAIGSAGLAALVLFSSFVLDIQDKLKGVATLNFDLSQPQVIAGLFIGGAIPYLFGALSMKSCRKGCRKYRERGAPAVYRNS